jgi:hypothetical protein
MSKLKNKIKNYLHEVTANELGRELDAAKGEVKRALPSIEDDEVEDIVTDVVTDKETNQNDSSTYTQKVSEEEGDLSKYPRHITPKTIAKSDRPSLQQKSNPEYNPDPAMDPRTGRRKATLQQVPNPIDEMGDDAVSRGIESGMNPESGIDYDELNAVIADINAEDSGEEAMGGYVNSDEYKDMRDGLPFESVNPRMTKDELMESILNQKKPKVIKRVKVKDIKNGK